MRELRHVAPENVKKEMESFKKKLDMWLALIPDQPNAEGLTKKRQADNNSLPNQFAYHHENIKRSWKTISANLKKGEKGRRPAVPTAQAPARRVNQPFVSRWDN